MAPYPKSAVELSLFRRRPTAKRPAEPNSIAPVRRERDAPARRTSFLVRWTLYIFLFSLCFEYYDPWGISVWFSLSKMAGFGLGIACVCDFRRTLLQMHWSVWVLGWTWSILAFSTLLVAGHTPGPLLSLGQCFVLYWISTNIFLDKEAAVNGLLAFAFGAFLVSVLMALGIGIEAEREAGFERVTFLGTNPNMIGIWEAVGIVIITGLVFQNPRSWGKWRFGLLLLLPAMLYTLINTGSRGAAISLGLGMLCFLLTKGGAWKRFASVFIGCAVIVAGVWWAQETILTARMQHTVDTGSMAGREELWQAAIRMIQQKPLLGWGMNDDSVIATDLGELNGTDPHNVFLAFFVFGGVLAGLPLLLLAAWWLLDSYRARRTNWGVLPLALGIVILSSMFKGGGFYTAKVAWFVLAFLTALSQRHSLTGKSPLIHSKKLASPPNPA